jgi:hypothetical protein
MQRKKADLLSESRTSRLLSLGKMKKFCCLSYPVSHTLWYPLYQTNDENKGANTHMHILIYISEETSNKNKSW